jgi:DNA-binding NarL/FixJ family response regulator
MAQNSTIKPTRLLLVDDHPIVLYGLKALLEGTSDFVLDHSCASNQQAISLASSECPDIIILDLQLPGRNGIEAIPELRQCCPKCKIVVYSSLKDNLYAVRSIKAGAHAYVHKEAGMTHLLDALRAVRNGKIFVSENIQQDMLRLHAYDRNPTEDLSILSNQELNVFQLIGNGLRLSDIAAKLGISPKTVGSHRERIKNKLTLNTGKELDQLAISHFSSLSERGGQK